MILADDAACMAQFGLKPVYLVKNAWQIKIVLQDVATWLAYTKGLQVQSLLIVGNAEIVPFHHLPTQPMTKIWTCRQITLTAA